MYNVKSKVKDCSYNIIELKWLIVMYEVNPKLTEFKKWKG